MKSVDLVRVPLVVAVAAAMVAQGLGPKGGVTRASAAADTTAVSAGKPFTVAVTLVAEAGWHVYWSNPGDAGIATSFEWKTPEGWKVESLGWPLPSKFVQPGDVVGYGYEGTTTFLFKVTPPENLRQAADLSVDVRWLSCDKERCVPGSKALQWSIPVGAGTAANEELFAAARAALPSAGPPNEWCAMMVPYPTENALQIGWVKMPTEVEVFPPAIDGLEVKTGAVRTAAGQPREGPLMEVSRTLAGSTVAEVKARVLAGQKVSVTKVPLLVTFKAPASQQRRGFYVDADLAAWGVGGARAIGQ